MDLKRIIKINKALNTHESMMSANFDYADGVPKEFKDFNRDKHKDLDAGKRFMGGNKRKRKRDLFKRPKKGKL